MNAFQWQEQTHVQGTYYHWPVAENRRARHEYEIEDTMVRADPARQRGEIAAPGCASIAESYAGEDNGRLVLFNANIPIYEPARDNHEPKRPRELLVKVRERNKLLGLSAARV